MASTLPAPTQEGGRMKKQPTMADLVRDAKVSCLFMCANQAENWWLGDVPEGIDPDRYDEAHRRAIEQVCEELRRRAYRLEGS